MHEIARLRALVELLRDENRVLRLANATLAQLVDALEKQVREKNRK